MAKTAKGVKVPRSLYVNELPKARGEKPMFFLHYTHESELSQKTVVAECYTKKHADLFAMSPELMKAVEYAHEAMCQATFNLRGRNCSDLNHAIDYCRELMERAKGTP